jgi:microcin C transport system substrate-binding protein
MGRLGRLAPALALVMMVAMATAMGMATATAALAAGPHHGIALYGEPELAAGFAHFRTVNPAAPKGGKVTLGALGSFDTLNPFTLKGEPADGIALIYDTLMASSPEEPLSQYGLLAETVEVPDDRSWAAFTLDSRARWHDGRPVTVDDVVFSFRTLIAHHPFWAGYYAGVATVRADGEHRVRFDFHPGDNRELPLILGQLPVLPRHYWEGRDFAASTLEPPLGSGPYKIAAVDAGRSLTLERVPDYWGRDLPVNVGRHNVDRLVYEYYRDATVALQAFRGGLIDFRAENIAKTWATGYDFPAVRDGKVVKEEIANRLPAGMQGYVFNTRRPIFADRRVRQAIGLAFDFEWTNESLFHGAYKRNASYFENSEMAARGLPSPAERALLEPLANLIPPEVLTEPFQPPVGGGPAAMRQNLLKARRLLEEAGWTIRDGVARETASGQPLTFEIVLDTPTFERITLPFLENLKRIGITASLRTIDTAQYQNRLRDFDYDMVVHTWAQSLQPGNEQRDDWGSAAAGRPGSQNLAGIRNEAVDRLIDRVVQAGDREALDAAVKALDRVLLWGHYVVPQWYNGTFRVAYWRRLKRPEPLPPYSLAFDSWWVDEQAAPAPAPAPKPGP